MDSINSSTLSPRNTQTVSGNTSRRPAQMPPGIGVRPVNVDQAFWRDVLFGASAIGNVAIVKGVLDAGLAGPDSSDPISGDTAMMHAAQHGQADTVRYLLAARATADQINGNCLTALGLATIARQSNITDVLARDLGYTLSNVDYSRQYTPDQQERIYQAEQALCDAEGRGMTATRPTFMPPEASN